ncbi:1-deoxy-D-xylulose-5-phosphate reductoisomerase [Parasutterella secunda]|uniref:1-deoxy-D-xylulose-5-phosphate reductoisomerase n=1 Tax=Parasutterella secunda TaxID=626947 RepID=UPI0025A3C35B|nr:1-deoxy-D-xylulose-5-phosphate reductoisomerase [Parasutterella secunda]MDM8225252.1 1-deoxy-D-xylulose-5-phosphate reductoisomerase [Parasutterella secunda]
MQNIAIFGATGSIGGSTLDVLSHYKDRYRVFALTANSRVEELVRLCESHHPRIALVSDESKKNELASALKTRGLTDIEVWAGESDLVRLAALPEVDVAVLAIVGAAGLAPTFSAARAGKRLLLANKESVVCGGALLMKSIKEHGAELLPVDSEHNAIFQCLACASEEDRKNARLILTASGGPFRKRMDLTEVIPEDAVAHPTWNMGRKISVDSATLMNKGLEVIEASWLFGFPPDRINVVIHPQSLIHSMVQYADGCILAQMGAPDMRTPIAYSLGWPKRLDGFAKRVDFAALGSVTFEAPDIQRFPQLGYAYEALRMGGAASIVLNAANEIAVEAFLDRRIRFLDIARACRQMMDSLVLAAPKSLEEVLAADREARIKTREVIAQW